MPSKKEDLIRLLEAELDVIEGGGYGRPVGEPTKEKPMFYRSVACIQHWVVPGHEPECHEDCILLDAVPEPYRKEALPCHFIPLNEAGETVHSLEQEGDQERLEEAVKDWLRTTIKRLKETQQDTDLPEVTY